MAELAVAFPTITDENFRAADTNHNGEISMEELAAAVESGKIPS
jgi:Ca2+-binding EF-hand superfamily protein